MRFRDIPGHEDVKERLRELVDSGKMPHALMLEGPTGTAKFALARALAQYIHCTDRHDGDSCGVCPACRQHQSMNHIDTVFSFPVVKRAAGKPTVSDDWLPEFRQFMTEDMFMNMDNWLKHLENPNTQPAIFVEEGAELLRRMSFTAHGSKYKVVLMWLPERMNEEAANKLLKLVEEPFPDTKFIMACDNPRQVLPTIYSRVQRVKVPRYDDTTVIGYLMSKGIESGAAADVAVLAEGNMIRVQQLLKSSADSDKYFDWFVELMRMAYQKKIPALKAWSQKVGAEKREPLARFLDFCCRMFRENFIFNFRDPAMNLQTEKERQFSRNFARFINERNVMPLLQAFTDARNDVVSNANGKIVLFDLAVTVVLLIRK